MRYKHPISSNLICIATVSTSRLQSSTSRGKRLLQPTKSCLTFDPMPLHQCLSLYFSRTKSRCHIPGRMPNQGNRTRHGILVRHSRVLQHMPTIQRTKHACWNTLNARTVALCGTCRCSPVLLLLCNTVAPCCRCIIQADVPLSTWNPMQLGTL